MRYLLSITLFIALIPLSYAQTDLSVIVLSTEDEVRPDSRLQIKSWIKNNSDDTVKTEIVFRLSEDSIYDTTDIVLDQSTFFILPNFCEQFGGSPLISDNIKPGEYFVIAKVDESNQIEEINESNNSISQQIEILENIEPQVDLQLTFEDSIIYLTRENPHTVGYKIVNIGKDYLDKQFGVAVYFSKDSILNPDEDFLYDKSTVNYDLFWPYIPLTVFSKARLPKADLDCNNCFLIYHIDPDSLVKETNENNNISTAKVVVIENRSELYLTSTSLKQTLISSGDSIDFKGVVKKISDTRSRLHITFFLSSDKQLSQDDRWLIEKETYFINDWKFYNLEVQIPIPENISEGNYHLLAHLDPLNSVDEQDENNVYSFPLKILTSANPKKDIELKGIGIDGVSEKLLAGRRYKVWYRLYNAGEEAANEYELSISAHISLDSLLDQEDLLLTEGKIFESINPNSLNCRVGCGSMSFVLNPNEVPDGDYYLIFRADSGDDWEEEDEVNNYRIKPINVSNPASGSKPDLTVDGLILFQDSLYAKEYASINFHYFNKGNIDTDPNKYQVKARHYLSMDSLLSKQDSLVAEDDLTSIQARSGKRYGVRIDVPTVQTGTYFLITQIDPDDAIDELEETNNTSYLKVRLKGTEPRASIVSLPSSVYLCYEQHTLTFPVEISSSNPGMEELQVKIPSPGVIDSSNFSFEGTGTTRLVTITHDWSAMNNMGDSISITINLEIRSAGQETSRQFDLVLLPQIHIDIQEQQAKKTSTWDVNIEISGGYSGEAYKTSLNGSAFEEAYLYSGLVQGTYDLSVRDSKSCQADTSFKVGKDVTISPKINQLKTTIFPNPTGDFVYFKNIPKRKMQFVIRDLIGRAILRPKMSDSRIDLRVLSSGVYQLEIESNTSLSVIPIIKE